MAGPGDGIAAGAGGQGHLRASHADREQVIDTLKAAFIQGRLTKDELDLRVGQTLASRTYADLAALTADIPSGLSVTPAPKPALVQPPPPTITDRKSAARAVAIATAIPAGLWAFVFLAPTRYVDNSAVFLLVTSSTFVWLIVLLLVAVDMHISRQERRSGENPSPPPGPGGAGRASQRPAPDRQLPPAGHDVRHTAEATQSRHLRRAVATAG